MLSNVLANASESGSLAQQGSKLAGGAEESGEGRFGHDVALSGDGGTVLVGAPGDDGELGAAWVFTRSGSGAETTWAQQGAKLTGGSEESGEGHFGGSVALSADGNTALVGAPRDNDGLGAVWVFARSGSTWTPQTKLTAGPEESASGGWFGDSVALSADGNTALVSAPVDHGDTGAVWVFTRSGSTWTRQAKLTGGSEEHESGWFGGSVALSADGGTALIGDPADAGKVGAVWVFARSSGSGSGSGAGSEATWTQQGPKLTGGAEEQGEGRFGDSVALSGDGNTALVGGRSNGGGTGAVWVFTRSGSDSGSGSGSEASWTQQGAKLTGSEGSGGESGGAEGGGGEGGSDEVGSGAEEGNEAESGQGRFGGSVSLSGDGNTALVGARNDGNGRGAVWVFARSGSTWTRQGPKLTGTEEPGKGQFGYSVALSADAQTAVIGGDADHGRVGAAWMFVQPSSLEPPPAPPVQPTPEQSSTTSSSSSSTTTTTTGTGTGTGPPKFGVKSFRAASGHVQLVSATIPVRPGRRAGARFATVKLRCLAAVACRGTLELTIPLKSKASPKDATGTAGAAGTAAVGTAGATGTAATSGTAERVGIAGRGRVRTVRLGVARFALAAGKTANVKLVLYSTVRARLAVAAAGIGGRVKASLTILTSAPLRRTQVHAVSLVYKHRGARG